MKISSERGQGLVEYLILVCLIGISSIAIVSIVGQNLKARYANISNSLRGRSGDVELDSAEEEHSQRSTMADFYRNQEGAGRGGFFD